MGRVAIMMSAGQPNAPMSSHFGKAEWIMISGTESTTPEFIRNEGLNGRSTVKLLVGQGCTDVILVDIGDGALRHLQAVTMYAWVVPGPVTGREALRVFAEGKLAPVPPVSAASSRGEGHGCCCGRHDAGVPSIRCCG